MLLALSYEGRPCLLDEGVLLNISARLLELCIDVLVEIFSGVAIALVQTGGFRVGQFGLARAIFVGNVVFRLSEGETVLPTECFRVTHFGGKFIFEVDVILGILRK
jgi:hypothetical protein